MNFAPDPIAERILMGERQVGADSNLGNTIKLLKLRVLQAFWKALMSWGDFSAKFKKSLPKKLGKFFIDARAASERRPVPILQRQKLAFT